MTAERLGYLAKNAEAKNDHKSNSIHTSIPPRPSNLLHDILFTSIKAWLPV